MLPTVAQFLKSQLGIPPEDDPNLDPSQRPYTAPSSESWDAAQQPTAGASASWAPPAYDPRQYDEGQRETGPAPWTPTSPEGTPASASVTQPAPPQYDYQIADGRTAPPTPGGDWREMEVRSRPEPMAQQEPPNPYGAPRSAAADLNPGAPADYGDGGVMRNEAQRRGIPNYQAVQSQAGEPDYVPPARRPLELADVSRIGSQVVGAATDAARNEWESIKNPTAFSIASRIFGGGMVGPGTQEVGNIVMAAINQFGDSVGRRVAQALGVPDGEFARIREMTIAGYKTPEISLSNEDVAGLIGSVLLDPTNLVGMGEAKPVARAVGRAALNVAEDVPGMVREAGQAAGRVGNAIGEEIAGQLLDMPTVPRMMQAGEGGLSNAVKRLTPDEAGSVVDYLAIRHDALNGSGVSDQLAGLTPDELRQTLQRWHAQGVFPEVKDARAFDDEITSALSAAERDALGRRVDPAMERAGYGQRATGDYADASPMSSSASENRRFGDDGGKNRLNPDEVPPPEIPRTVDDAPRDNSITMNATPGISRSAGLIGDAANSLGGGVMGAATGAALPADTEEQRRQNALTGAGIGMIAGPAVGRVLPRTGGAQIGFGVGGRPAGQSAAAANDPIMQRMARQMAGQHTPSPVKNVRSLAERWAQAWTDDRAGLRTLQESVAAKIGRPLRADESVAELTRVNPNSIASQRLVEEVAPAWRKVGEDEDYLAQYVVHMHNVDVAREMGQRAYDAAIAAGRSPQQASAAAIRAANTRQFSGDLRLNDTLAQLQAIEQRVLSLPDGQQRWQAIKDGAQASWDFNRKTLERKRDAGIIDPALYQELTQRYPHYVRTDIADYFEKGGSGPTPGGKRIGISDIGIQKIGAEGTTKERVNPLLSLIDQAYTSEAAIVRNKAGQAFEELLRLDPDWQNVFKEVVPAQGVNRGNPATTVPSSYTLKNGEQKLTVWQNGQPRQFIVPPEYAALVSPQAGSIFGDSAPVQFLRSAMNAYKALITSKNPAFSMLISPIRDFGDYAIREMTLSAKDQGVKGAGQAVWSMGGVLGDYFRALPDAFAGFTQGQFKGDLATLMREGAGMAGRPGRSQRELRQALDELTRTNGLQVRNLGDLGRVVGDVLTLGAEPIGGRLEQVPRLAAARRAERRGAPMLGQVMSARDATVDFQRAGEWARVLNTAIPFFNVAIQSGAQTARTFRKNPAAALASVATAVGVPALAAEVWNHSDEQLARDYEDVPDYLKKTGLVFMLPNVEGVSERGDRLPNYLWLPVGQFGTLLEAAKTVAQNAARDGVSGPEQNSVGGWAKLGADLAAEGFGIFSPIRGESAGAMLSSLVPPGLGTGIELAANKDLFRGSTIATDRRDESASAMAQGSANAFNAVTGMETRPSQWDYLYRDLGGYGATLAGAGSNMLAEAMGMRQPKQEDRPIQSAPVVGGLVNRLVRDAGGQRLENATEDRTRVPEGVQSALDEAGLRRDAVAPVPSKYKGAPLTRDEQEQWQQTTNDLIERKVAQATRSSDWRARGADKEKILRAAVSDAKEEAAARALRRLTDSEIERRKRTEQQRKAS